MLDPLEQSVLLAVRRLTADTYNPTDGQAVAEELERQGCRPKDDMTLIHLLMRLRDDGYISPKAYFGADGLKAIVSVDLTVQGRESADQSDQPQVPSDAESTGSHQTSAADPTKVMVVHGRDDDARRAMFGFLEAIGLMPLEWGELVAETGSAAPYIGQVLKKAFETAKAVVVLFTPDDEAWLKEAFHKSTIRPMRHSPRPKRGRMCSLRQEWRSVCTLIALS